MKTEKKSRVQAFLPYKKPVRTHGGGNIERERCCHRSVVGFWCRDTAFKEADASPLLNEFVEPYASFARDKHR